MSRETVELSFQVIAMTEDGLLLSDGDDQAWWPRSQMETDATSIEVGETYDFIVPAWLARTKGAI